MSPLVERFARDIGARLDGSPLCLMLDIDGTLAPIAPRPEDATVPTRTRDVLEALAALPDVTIALITGRSAQEARRMVSIDRVWIVGNHGIELRTPEGAVTANAEAREYERHVARAFGLLERIVRSVPGAILEDKRWSLSLHYRLADPGAVPDLLRQANDVARTAGLRVTEGKKIVELRPPVAIDKGTAALLLAERLHVLDVGASLLFAGDDRTDEDAFRALRGRKDDVVTIRILAEADGLGTSTDAELVLPSPDELRQALEWVLARRAPGTDV